LSVSGRQRTQEIGAQLNRKGGMPKMLSAHREITAQRGHAPGREPEAAWDGLGSCCG
jgi:hypothetical protein